MPEETLNIRLRLQEVRQFVQGTKTAQAGIKGISNETQRTDNRARRARGGFQMFRKDIDATGKASRFGAGSLKRLASAVAAASAAYLSLGAAKKAVSTTIDLAKSTLGLSRNLGLTTQQASEWSAVAKVRGIQDKNMMMSFTKLSKTVDSARGGNEKALSTFKRLGVGQRFVMDKSTSFNDILMATADGFGKLEGGTKRATLAQGLFGRGAQGIIPLFKEGAATLQGDIDMANKYGATMGDKPLSSIKDYLAMQRELKFAQLGAQVQFTTKIMPMLVKGADLILKLVEGWRGLRSEFKMVGIAVIGVAGAIAAGPMGIVIALAAAAYLIYKNWSLIGPVFQKAAAWIMSSLGLTSTDLQSFARFVMGAAKVWWFLFGPVVRGTIAGFLQFLRGVFQIIGGVIKLFGAIARGDWRAAWAAIKQIVRGAVNVVIGTLRLMLAPVRLVAGAIVRILRGAWMLVKAGARAAFGFLRALVTNYIGFWRSVPGRLARVFSGMWNGLKTGFKEAINFLIRGWNGLSLRISGVKIDPPGPGSLTIPAVNLNTPDLPTLASGGRFLTGGSAIIGDKGPELATFPPGAQIDPLPLASAISSSLPVRRVDTPTAPRDDARGVRSALVQVVMPDGRVLAETVANFQADEEARR